MEPKTMNQFFQEIQEQPKALIQTGQYQESPDGKKKLSQMAELWFSGKYDKIILTGMGSSYFIATAAASLLNAFQIPAFALNAGELLHYQLPIITPRVLLICISQSGESYEVIRLLDKIPADCTVLSICNEADSTLAKQSRYTLLCQAGKEEKTSTKTFITCYQAAYLLTMKLAKQEKQDYPWEQLAQTIDCMVKGTTPWMNKALTLINNPSFIQLIGRGPIFASVSQSALMFMEATHTPASALSGGEFRHGPLEMVKNGFTAILFAHSQSNTYQQSLTLLYDILKYNGKVIFITDKDTDTANDRLCCIPIPCKEEALFAIPGIVPVQLLINEWATRRDVIPGEFTHGAKVTTRE